MSYPKRILQYGLSTSLAGIEVVIMDLYRQLDRDKIQFDFLMMHEQTPYFADEITKMGGRIYNDIYLRGENLWKGCTWNRSFFRGHPEFYGIHCNVSSLLSIDRILTPLVCRNIPLRIVHAHNTGDGCGLHLPQNVGIKRLQSRISGMATHLIACSADAGLYNFGPDNAFQTILDGINLQKFRFSSKLRLETRKKLGIEERLVIGNVGKMRYQKNHEYLLDVFAELLRRREDAVLLLVGEGELESAIRSKAQRLGIDEKIIFAGNQDDVNPFYCAMDKYVMPTRYEGFALVLMEAQSSGLTCVASKTVVPREVNVTGNISFVDLQGPVSGWVDEILRISPLCDEKRTEISQGMNRYHCDVTDVARQFEKIYLPEFI